MEIQISKKPEITIGVCHSLGIFGYFALPFSFSWWCVTDVKGSKNREFAIDFLCFRFWIKYWKWATPSAKQLEAM